MLKQVLTILIICYIPICSTVIVNHEATDNLIRIYYDNPCSELFSFIKDPSVKYATEHLECNYGYKHTKFEHTNCQHHYDTNWIRALNELANCHLSKRSLKREVRVKRGLTSLVTNPSIITVATNMVKTLFTRGDQKDLINKIKTDYKITNILTVNVMEDVYMNSNNIYNHQQEAKESQQVPDDVRGVYLVHKGIAQKSALVRIIAHTCKASGQLATAETAELTENEQIALIKPSSTIVTKSMVDFNNSVIELYYETLKEIVVQDRPQPEDQASNIQNSNVFSLLIVIIILSCFLLFILLSIVLYCLLRKKSNQSQPIELRTPPYSP